MGAAGVAPPQWKTLINHWEDPAMEKKICRMILSHLGKDAAHRDVDLLVQDGRPPIAVLEWADYPDGTSTPSVALQLDPKYLHPLPPSWAPVTHLYEQQMDSPIPLPRP